VQTTVRLISAAAVLAFAPPWLAHRYVLAAASTSATSVHESAPRANARGPISSGVACSGIQAVSTEGESRGKWWAS